MWFVCRYCSKKTAVFVTICTCMCVCCCMCVFDSVRRTHVCLSVPRSNKDRKLKESRCDELKRLLTFKKKSKQPQKKLKKSVKLFWNCCDTRGTLQVLFALNQTLLQHEGVRAGSLQGSYTTEDLITHYNCGDLNSIIFNHDTSQLPHFINSSLPAHDRMTAMQIDNYFRQELIYKRNERMARRVSALLQKNPNQTFFFAFGAGHFLGNHSVLDILKLDGYEITNTIKTIILKWKENKTSTVTPTSWPTGLEEEMEDPDDVPGLQGEELPHMLLPDSLNQLEEFGRHKRPHKAHRSHGRPRLFSDLWVRFGDSTPPPNVRIINGYITVEPPLTHQEQHRQLEIFSIERHADSPSPTLHSLSSAQLAHTSLTLSCILAWFLSHMLLTS
uniref:Metalloprotease TIKI n=1 Tax=Xiphophorus couchianus TaxID=32473 RepID=A0A3B5LRF4_9TELE